MVYKQLYPTNDYSNMDIVVGNWKKNFEELKRIDAEQPKDSLLYRYFTEPYADGKIFWQVIKVNKKTCHILACEGICGDEWQKGIYSVSIEFVKQSLNSRLKLESLFK